MYLKLSVKPSKPDFVIESSINGLVCGLDEVGRGPLAGSVVAACVYVPENIKSFEWITQIRDSKKLSHKKLEYLHSLIQEHCIFGIGECSPEEIDDINILQASLVAMSRAFKNMNSNQIVHALVDGNHLPELPCKATAIIKGDNISTSIAAASIIAKVTRDKTMKKLAEKYPYYGWERNVGYPTKEHLAGIATHGITPHHRKSFAPVRRFIESSNNSK